MVFENQNSKKITRRRSPEVDARAGPSGDSEDEAEPVLRLWPEMAAAQAAAKEAVQASLQNL